MYVIFSDCPCMPVTKHVSKNLATCLFRGLLTCPMESSPDRHGNISAMGILTLFWVNYNI